METAYRVSVLARQGMPCAALSALYGQACVNSRSLTKMVILYRYEKPLQGLTAVPYKLDKVTA